LSSREWNGALALFATRRPEDLRHFDTLSSGEFRLLVRMPKANTARTIGRLWARPKGEGPGLTANG